MISDFNPKLFPRNDFWRQIQRTINGEPVSQAQIDLIIESIQTGLQLFKDDALLDLACGNGALIASFKSLCYLIDGVDYSEYLIEIAEEYFKLPGGGKFFCADVEDFLLNDQNPLKYTKALCYGSFAYFNKNKVEQFFYLLTSKYINCRRIMLGNVPDLQRVKNFNPNLNKDDPILFDEKSAIGIWYSSEMIQELAKRYGWAAEIKYMPPLFYAQHYRFDVVLTRKV